MVLLDAGNNTLGTQYLTGIGQGSLAVMVPGAVSIMAGQVGEWTMVNDGVRRRRPICICRRE